MSSEVIYKHCNKCNTTKNIAEFSKDKTAKDGLQGRCKSCEKIYRDSHKEAAKAYREEHKESAKLYAAQYKCDNKDKLKISNTQYYHDNKESAVLYRTKNKDRIKLYQSQYRLTNRGRVYSHNAKRRAAKLNATPFWSEFELILEVYANAARMSAASGICYQVDHIIPLQSKIVCGLHVLANLQILTAAENSSKYNNFIPEDHDTCNTI